MRLALACLALLAVAADPRGGGCGTPPAEPYQPCAAKACGDACTLCAPGDPSCVEAMFAKACDGHGACAAIGNFTCPAATGTDPCAGKACGDACAVEPACRLAAPPCLMPTLLGRCDAGGLCVAAEPVCAPPPPGPDPRCAGVACHAACDPCPPGAACPMTLCTTWCDGDGRCSCTGGGAPCP